MCQLQHSDSGGTLRKPSDNSGLVFPVPGSAPSSVSQNTLHSTEGPSTCSLAGNWQIPVSSEGEAIWQLHVIFYI